MNCQHLKTNISSSTPNEYLEPAFWLVDGGADEGLNYCSSCASKERGTHGPDCEVSGGWLTEHDVAIQCENCSVPLAGYLFDDDSTLIETRDQWSKWVQSSC